jgi:hypothetical protein
LPLCLAAALLAGLPTSSLARPGQSFAEAQSHWAYQPIPHPTPPTVQHQDRVQSPIDAFLLSKLEAASLSFAPPADPRTLIRRLYFDLIGLPPSTSEVEAFAQDTSPTAVARLVDQLLADPRYGERWGRHWLDVARYADTKDLVLVYGKDALRPYAYTYRDYVIRAFNEDLPFDTFVRDQIAADLTEPAPPPWRLAALGFLTLGRLFDNNPHDRIDDQIDTVTRGFLGITVSCARCHDHKYDAVVMEDYYGLYGVFASTEQPNQLPLIEDPQTVPGGPEFEAKLAAAIQELDNLILTEHRRLTAVFRERFPEYLLRAATTPPDLTETAQFALSLTPDDFRPALMLRTRQMLAQRRVPADPVFGWWADLDNLPDEDFPTLAQQFLQAPPNTTPDAPPRNAVVLDFLRRHPPATKADIPLRYAELFRQHERATRPPATPEEAPPSQPTSPDHLALSALLDPPTSPVWFPLRDTSDHLSRPEKDRHNGLVLNLDKIAAHADLPPPARAMVVADLPQPYESRVFGRGNPSRPSRPAPRGFLRVLNQGDPQTFSHGSGRRELAEAIASPDNPLTARVLVNRVWMHHFGQPLVASTTDFGTRAEPPSHPELLDWLARQFIDSGWRLKTLHRHLVLSAAYQQSSTPPPHQRSVDPENQLLGHYPRRRLDLESMRDSLLHLAHRLDPTLGGPSVDIAHDPDNRRRSVYGLVDRQNLPDLFRAFDFAAPDQCAERRPLTTVPQQALFALNSPFVITQARAVAALPQLNPSLPTDSRINALFQHILARPASPTEIQQARRFLDTATDEPRFHRWEQLTQVLLISNEALFLD